MNYIPKTKARWIATRCTNAKCKSRDDHATEFVLKRGLVPACDACGSPMKFNPADIAEGGAE